MQRGLSAENIADFAHHAVSHLRRLVSSSSLHDATLTPSQLDLLSTTKQIEEANHRKTIGKVDTSVVELWAHSFADELEFLVTHLQETGQQSSPENSSSNSSAVGSPKAPLPATVSPSRKPLADSQLLQANDCTKILLRMLDRTAADSMYHARLFDAFLRVIVLCATMLSKRLIDAFVATVSDCLAEFPFVLEGTVAQTVVEVLDGTATSDLLNPQRLRLLLLLSNSLKRMELLAPVASKSVKARLQSLGLTTLLIRQCRLLEAFFEQESTRHGVALTALILSLVNVSCIARGTQEIKQLVLNEDIQSMWTLGVNNIHKMDCVVAYQSSMSLVSSNKTEERLITFENTTIWAAELAEMLVELCTTSSFSLQRQMLYVESTPLPPTPPASRDLPVANAPLSISLRRWEPLPQNWDTTLSSGAPIVWRLASTLLSCNFSVDSVKSLFRFLRHLDTSQVLGEYVYRSIVATVLLLCHGSPSNVETLSKASALNLLIESLTDTDVTAFGHGMHRRIGMSRSHSGSFDAAATPPSVVTVASSTRQNLSEGSRSMAMALLSVLATSLGNDDIQLLTNAVEMMRTHETTAEDCEVIEHMLHTISGTVYARNAVFFSGDASVVCPVERFVGRWYGYTFVTWVNPLCVWGEGCHLFSFSDPSTPSSVVVSIVANGRSRSLAVRCLNGMDFSITLLPDTALSPDGWTHLAIVHNISGFFVYINGRKSSCNVSVPFPKEPRKSQLLYFGLGGAEQPNSATHPNRSLSQVAVPSLFGFTASMEVWDGQVSEKDLDRLVAAGPCSSIGMEPPVCSTPPLLFVNSILSGEGDIELDVGGAIVKKEAVRMSSAVAHRNADVPGMFTTLQVVAWAVETIRSLVGNPTPNRNTIAVLCCEFVCTAFRLATKEKVLAKYHESQTIENIRRSLLDWEAPVPHQLAQCLLALTIPRNSGKRMRSHPTTSAVLDLLLDVMGSRQCSPAFYCTTFKELSELFSVPENAKVFREDSSRFNSVLLLTQFLPSEAIDDFIALVEKLCKEQAEVECLLRFITFDEASKKSEVIRCESLRMLFDTARPNVALCDMIANAFSGNGVWWLLHLIEGAKHHSEAVRVYAIRLLALILHCSKKARETFAKGNGFEVLGAALVAGGAINARLMTYNCLFKFALDFFQPTVDRADAALARLHGTTVTPARHIDPRAQASGASLGFHGHLPGLMPGRTGRREYSFDFGMGSECGDVEGRLSVDENYSAQTVSKDLLVHPHVVQIILSMVGRMLTAYFRESSESSAHLADDRGDLMSSEEHHSATSLTTSRREAEDSVENIALKIFAYLDRIVDMTPNAVAMLSHPWMEWIWTAFEPVFVATQRENCTASQRNLAMAAETQVRSIVRKISVVDLSRPAKSSNLKRVKDLVDEPCLQRILFEEVVRHFSANNRLDTMEPNDATNVIRNVDTLFQGIEEALSPMPSALGVEIALAIRDIAVNNNMWVRLKMKNTTKLFESRDRLAFSLLSSIRLFSHEGSQLLQDLVHVNQHDPNAMIVVLRNIVDAVGQRNLEEVEALQSMLRHLYSLDDEQRKCLQRVLETDSVELLVLPSQRVIGNNQQTDTRASNPDGSVSQDFISWCMANDGKWEAMTFKIQRACRNIDNDIKSSNERKEKERNAKFRTRKTESERRVTTFSKFTADFEKLKSDIDTKGMASFVDSVAEAKNARKTRDLIVLTSPSKN